MEGRACDRGDLMLTDNPHYQASARAIRELHRLLHEGLDDSDEADRIRDESDKHWWPLSANEIDSLQNLSADLYTIGNESHQENEVSGRDESNVGQQIREALTSGDHSQVVRLLKQSPSEVSPQAASCFRSFYWMAQDDFESDLLFMDEAIRLDPENVVFLTFRLILLWSLNDNRSYSEAVSLLENPRLLDLDASIQVATILVLSAYDRMVQRGNLLEGLEVEERTAIDRATERLQNVLGGNRGTDRRPTPTFERIGHQIVSLSHWLQAEVTGFISERATTSDANDQTLRSSVHLLNEMVVTVRQSSKKVFVDQFTRLAA